MPAGPRITLVRRLKATPRAVFEAWTNPHRLVRWWGGIGATQTIAQSDTRAGGSFLISGRRASGEPFEDWGIYLVVLTDEVLEFSWRGDRDARSHVTIQLLQLAYTTELTLVHFELPDAESCAAQRIRWEAALDALEALVDPPQA